MRTTLPHFLSVLTIAIVLLGTAGCDAQTAADPTPRHQQIPSSAIAKPIAQYTDFNRFWAAFRSASLSRNMAAVAQLAAFPLLQRGELDDGPQARIDRAGLRAAFDRALRNDSGMEVREPVVLSAIRAKPAFAPDEIDARSQDFGPFRFARTPCGWKLVGLMVGEP